MLSANEPICDHISQRNKSVSHDVRILPRWSDAKGFAPPAEEEGGEGSHFVGEPMRDDTRRGFSSASHEHDSMSAENEDQISYDDSLVTSLDPANLNERCYLDLSNQTLPKIPIARLDGFISYSTLFLAFRAH